MCTLRNYTIQEWKHGKNRSKGNGLSNRIINAVPGDILGDFWMNHSYEYQEAEKVRGRIISALYSLGIVLSAAAVLAGMLTLAVWVIFRADVIFCFGVFYVCSLPFVLLDQIFRRAYESVRMGFDRGTVLRQAFFGRSLLSGFCYGPWWRY